MRWVVVWWPGGPAPRPVFADSPIRRSDLGAVPRESPHDGVPRVADGHTGAPLSGTVPAARDQGTRGRLRSRAAHRDESRTLPRRARYSSRVDLRRVLAPLRAARRFAPAAGLRAAAPDARVGRPLASEAAGLGLRATVRARFASRAGPTTARRAAVRGVVDRRGYSGCSAPIVCPEVCFFAVRFVFLVARAMGVSFGAAHGAAIAAERGAFRPVSA